MTTPVENCERCQGSGRIGHVETWAGPCPVCNGTGRRAVEQAKLCHICGTLSSDHASWCSAGNGLPEKIDQATKIDRVVSETPQHRSGQAATTEQPAMLIAHRFDPTTGRWRETPGASVLLPESGAVEQKCMRCSKPGRLVALPNYMEGGTSDSPLCADCEALARKHPESGAGNDEEPIETKEPIARSAWEQQHHQTYALYRQAAEERDQLRAELAEMRQERDQRDEWQQTSDAYVQRDKALAALASALERGDRLEKERDDCHTKAEVAAEHALVLAQKHELLRTDRGRWRDMAERAVDSASFNTEAETVLMDEIRAALAKEPKP